MEDLSCADCIPKNDTADEIDRIRRKRESLGCEKDTDIPIFTDDEGNDYYRCPVKSIDPETWVLIDLYGFYEQGHLPVDGGVMNQPAYLMNCFAIIKSQKVLEQKERA